MMEFLRTDEFGTGDIRYNQVFAALVFVGAFIWLVYLRKRSRKAELEVDDEEVEPSEYSEIVEKMKKEEQETEQAVAEENTPNEEVPEKENLPEPEPAEEENRPEVKTEDEENQPEA